MQAFTFTDLDLDAVVHAVVVAVDVIVAVVDVASRKVRDYILVGKRPWGLALSRDEKTLYVANGLSDDLTIINAVSLKVVKSVPVGMVPYGILIDD